MPPASAASAGAKEDTKNQCRKLEVRKKNGKVAAASVVPLKSNSKGKGVSNDVGKKKKVVHYVYGTTGGHVAYIGRMYLMKNGSELHAGNLCSQPYHALVAFQNSGQTAAEFARQRAVEMRNCRAQPVNMKEMRQLRVTPHVRRLWNAAMAEQSQVRPQCFQLVPLPLRADTRPKRAHSDTAPMTDCVTGELLPLGFATAVLRHTAALLWRYLRGRGAAVEHVEEICKAVLGIQGMQWVSACTPLWVDACGKCNHIHTEVGTGQSFLEKAGRLVKTKHNGHGRELVAKGKFERDHLDGRTLRSALLFLASDSHRWTARSEEEFGMAADLLTTPRLTGLRRKRLAVVLRRLCNYSPRPVRLAIWRSILRRGKTFWNRKWTTIRFCSLARKFCGRIRGHRAVLRFEALAMQKRQFFSKPTKESRLWHASATSDFDRWLHLASSAGVRGWRAGMYTSTIVKALPAGLRNLVPTRGKISSTKNGGEATIAIPVGGGMQVSQEENNDRSTRKDVFVLGDEKQKPVELQKQNLETLFWCPASSTERPAVATQAASFSTSSSTSSSLDNKPLLSTSTSSTSMGASAGAPPCPLRKRMKLSGFVEGVRIVKQIIIHDDTPREEIKKAWTEFVASGPSLEEAKKWRYWPSKNLNLTDEGRSRGGKNAQETIRAVFGREFHVLGHEARARKRQLQDKSHNMSFGQKVHDEKRGTSVLDNPAAEGFVGGRGAQVPLVSSGGSAGSVAAPAAAKKTSEQHLLSTMDGSPSRASARRFPSLLEILDDVFDNPNPEKRKDEGCVQNKELRQTRVGASSKQERPLSATLGATIHPIKGCTIAVDTKKLKTSHDNYLCVELADFLNCRRDEICHLSTLPGNLSANSEGATATSHFRFTYSSMVVHLNAQTQPHLDRGNVGDSVLTSVGDFVGGGVFVHDPTLVLADVDLDLPAVHATVDGRPVALDVCEKIASDPKEQARLFGSAANGNKPPENILHAYPASHKKAGGHFILGREFDTKDKFLQFNAGENIHATMPWTGKRYAVVLFTHSILAKSRKRKGQGMENFVALMTQLREELGFPLPSVNEEAYWSGILQALVDKQKK
ncbi:unnamed protein product [Amoebophrya sp. A120]|nr:unnamed protein product [Amoebophrya sp. A120]|eukprot:GSA120T00018177001.1